MTYWSYEWTERPPGARFEKTSRYDAILIYGVNYLSDPGALYIENMLGILYSILRKSLVIKLIIRRNLFLLDT